MFGCGLGTVPDDSLPLPDHPVLTAHARALNEAGFGAEVLGASFRLVDATDELRRSLAGLHGLVAVPIGRHFFASERYWSGSESFWSEESRLAVEATRELFTTVFPELLAATPGGRAELRQVVDARLHDLLDALPDGEARAAVAWQGSYNRVWGLELGTRRMISRIHDDAGRIAGYVLNSKPAAGIPILGTVAGAGNVRHLERMQDVVTADRRPAAILFADLEASSTLSRRLSTVDYFNLARRLVRVADQCAVDAGGLVGRHLGDGVTAFFLAEVLGSESAAARAAIDATRALRNAAAEIAEPSRLTLDDVVFRFGLHWGATLYGGLIKTVARSEVTALGDEVNEAARIEAGASGGRALASKALVERLGRTDAAALGLEQVTYVPLGEMATATDKARRDAPAIAVCDV